MPLWGSRTGVGVCCRSWGWGWRGRWSRGRVGVGVAVGRWGRCWRWRGRWSWGCGWRGRHFLCMGVVSLHPCVFLVCAYPDPYVYLGAGCTFWKLPGVGLRLQPLGSLLAGGFVSVHLRLLGIEAVGPGDFDFQRLAVALGANLRADVARVRRVFALFFGWCCREYR